MKEALRLEDVHFSYRDQVPVVSAPLSLSRIVMKEQERSVVEGANLSMERGETLCIAGLSGQGKSVLLHLIAGLEKPSKGKVCYFGEYLSPEQHNPLEIARRGVGMVFQNGALISNLKVRENVALPLHYHHLGTPEEIEEKVNRALDLMRVRSEENKYPHTLSVGMRKRVAIARAWAMDPKLLLMDDPMAGLDNYNRQNLLPLIDNMRILFKTAIIIVTHDLSLAEDLQCRISLFRSKLLTEPQSFDYWKHSEEPMAKELFRGLHRAS
ncbi:MAG: ATP-binding cassette domain-containing protein [Fibrobacter sp.]|jgi:phospholipid/cholesterol/gamma-HCH transport system ATP-binding protein|nr:ATP-binding cassette domain-containing protein [Fibrobacter sp.]